MVSDDSKHPPRPRDSFIHDNATPPLETPAELIAYLYSNGHFNPRDADNLATSIMPWDQVCNLDLEAPLVKMAVFSWQEMRHGMPLTGIFCSACHDQAVNETAFRCGMPDIIPRAARTSKWDDPCKHDITCCHTLDDLDYSGKPPQQIDHDWDRGMQYWNDAADLTMIRIPWTNSARVRAHAQRMSGNILAWSQLPPGSCNVNLDQAYNTRVRWSSFLLHTTIGHELGHALGIGHGGRGLMQPAHDPNFTQLDDWDLDQIRKRYGPREQPPPPPPTPAGNFHHAKIELYDDKDRLIVTYSLNALP